MTIHVRLFARAKDIVGTDILALDLPCGATVGDLRQRLANAYPLLAGLLERSALAIDDEWADDHQTLAPLAEVALLPPVSGGTRFCSSSS